MDFRLPPKNSLTLVRGSVKDNHLDIYMERLEDAKKFGRKDIYVFIIQGDG